VYLPVFPVQLPTRPVDVRVDINNYVQSLPRIVYRVGESVGNHLLAHFAQVIDEGESGKLRPQNLRSWLISVATAPKTNDLWCLIFVSPHPVEISARHECLRQNVLIIALGFVAAFL